MAVTRVCGSAAAEARSSCSETLRRSRVLSEAFTDRYRRDGCRVRVPFLTRGVALLDRDAAGADGVAPAGWHRRLQLRARSGPRLEWAARVCPRAQAQGGVAGRRSSGSASSARVIASNDAAPMDNSASTRRAASARRLTITVTIDAARAAEPRCCWAPHERRRWPRSRGAARSPRAALGYDFTRESNPRRAALATPCCSANGQLAGSRSATPCPRLGARGELRVLKLVLVREEHSSRRARSPDYARRTCPAGRVRCGRVRLCIIPLAIAPRAWTDLRMTVDGHAEQRARGGVVLSNWEI